MFAGSTGIPSGRNSEVQGTELVITTSPLVEERAGQEARLGRDAGVSIPAIQD